MRRRSVSRRATRTRMTRNGHCPSCRCPYSALPCLALCLLLTPFLFLPPRWVLDEWGVRFGMGPVARKLEYLRVLANTFSILPYRVDLFIALLNDVLSMVDAGLVTEQAEKEVAASLISLVYDEMCLKLRQYDVIWHNLDEVKAGKVCRFDRFCAMFENVVRLPVFAEVRPELFEERHAQLRLNMEMAMRVSHARLSDDTRKELDPIMERWAADPSMPHVLPTRSIIERVVQAIETVRLDVKLAPLVPEYFHFDLVSRSVNMFTEGLVAAVTRFLAISDPAVAGPGVFELYKVTCAAIEDSRRVAEATPSRYAEPIVEHDVSRLFFPFLDSYLTRAGPKLEEWTSRSVALDPLVPISDRVQHSSSIVDVFSSIDQALDFIVKLQWPISVPTR